MSESLQFPGSPSAQRKSDYLTKIADIFQTMRGDETFIRVTKGPGGLLISLNWQAVVARVPKTVGGGGGNDQNSGQYQGQVKVMTSDGQAGWGPIIAVELP